MPVLVEVIEQDHIVKLDVSDPWDIGEVMDVDRLVLAVLESVDHPVHELVDLSSTRNMPAGMVGIPTRGSLSHPRMGYVAVFGASYVVKVLLSAFFKATRIQKFRMFETHDEALAFLHEMIASESPGGSNE